MVAVDAVSVSPNISVSKNGEVTGLVDIERIDKSEAVKIISSVEEFAKFVEMHANQATRYFFVIYLCPLDRQYVSIPICLIPQTSGSANESITSAFDEVINNLRFLDFDAIGEAYDGDPGWLSRAFSFAQEICQMILQDLTLTLEDIAEISVHANNDTFVYEDLLHLVKCDRYRKASGAKLCPALYEAKATISQEAFVQNGIPKWIVDNNNFYI